MIVKKILLTLSLSAMFSSFSVIALDNFVPFERKEKDPDVSEDNFFANFDIQQLSPVKQRRYKEIMVFLDEAIGKVAQDYVKMANSPLLNFSSALSKKYLELLQAYVKMQMKLNIPALANAEAGSLKGLALSHQDVLELEKLANDKNFQILVTKIEETAPQTENQEKLWGELFKSAPDFNTNPNLQTVHTHYSNLDIAQKTLLKKAHQFAGFRHVSHVDLTNSILKLIKKNVPSNSAEQTAISHLFKHPKDFKSRLFAEIQQRVMNLSAREGQSSYGALGSNVLALWNVITKGEPNYPLSEFRNKMYFVYMLNDFVNEVLLLPNDQFDTLNAILQNDFGWSLDKNLITYLKDRRSEVSHIAPLFRYGAYADLNTKGLRKYKTTPSNTPTPVLNSRAFSPRERVALYGNNASKASKPITIYSGKEAFELETDPNTIRSDKNAPKQAAEYLEIVNRLGLPVVAGISGTLDQSLTMARLVGLADTPEKMKLIRLAYIAFMVPNHDHTVHEILESSKSFGLSYKATPRLYDEVLDQQFSSKVKREMKINHNIDIDKLILEVARNMYKGAKAVKQQQ